MLTSVVIVNWNTREMTKDGISLVRRHTDIKHEIIVVDNGSTDGSVEMIKNLGAPDLKPVFLQENLGFAGGNNCGIETAKGEFICLLNSDAFVTPGWLHGMQLCMHRTGADMVGPWTNKCKGIQSHQRRHLIVPKWLRKYREVDYLSFFCVLIHRRVFDRIGYLDERFGLGTFEDDDFCLRARRAGFKLVVDSRSWVWHEAHATMNANNLQDSDLIKTNRLIFEEKWKGTQD